jgi:hypothetical protein
MLERTEQTHESLKQNSLHSCWDLYLGQTEYKAWELFSLDLEFLSEDIKLIIQR